MEAFAKVEDRTAKASEREEARGAIQASASKGGSLLPRVLVIDDERLLGQTIQLGLEDTMDVELEVSGRKGLERLLSAEEFALILCDLSMPEISGIEIYRRIAEERPELTERFVVMTGGAVTAESRDFLDNYQGTLLQKPFTLSQVEGLAKRLIKAG
jgi:CheY-like chemotaxis protein